MKYIIETLNITGLFVLYTILIYMVLNSIN